MIIVQFVTLPATYELHGRLQRNEQVPRSGEERQASRGCCYLCIHEPPAGDDKEETPRKSKTCLICRAVFAVATNDFHSPEVQRGKVVGDATQLVVTPPSCAAILRWYGRGPPFGLAES